MRTAPDHGTDAEALDAPEVGFKVAADGAPAFDRSTKADFLTRTRAHEKVADLPAGPLVLRDKDVGRWR